MRVVFMGTPDIAATCLKKIIADGFEIVGVYTQPDRPKGRGMKLVASPVKEVALNAGIPVFQPENFREEETVEQLRQLKPDICAVVAYGRILPQKVLDVPKFGCINIHASCLPQYRGSAPYQWAVLDGLTETGVTAMYLCREMDAGDIIEISKTPIGENETAGELLDRLAVLGADLLSKTLTRFEHGPVTAVPQNPEQVSYAPMLDKTMCPLDFTKSAQQLHNQVRGLHPWPVATMEFQGKKFKVHETRVLDGSGQPGEVLGLTKTGLILACGEGALEIRSLQVEGGKRMAAPDYFRGHPPERLMGARETALHGLMACRRDGAWSNGVLKEYIARDRLDSRDAALATRLCYGVLQNRGKLDFYLKQLLIGKLSSLHPVVRDILHLGLYQIYELDKIPDSAAVNESVTLAKKYGKNPRAGSLVNGVLRNAVRTKGTLKEPTSYADRYSHPDELISLLKANLPKGMLEPMLMADNEAPETTIQVNTLKVTAAKLLEILEAEHVSARPHGWMENCLVLSGTGSIDQLPSFREGLYYVQDPAAKLSVLCARLPVENIRVLDCCSAPGGKSFAAAMAMEGKGQITSCDVHAHKTGLIEKGAERLGLTNITARLQDATQTVPEWVDSMDVVIADVPCSGLGIIRKKPDIRYKNIAEMEALPALQLNILENQSKYVKKGGVLLYSTCTVLRRENEDIVASFLEKHPDFETEPLELPEVFPKNDTGMLTLIPGQYDTDGFFICRLRRKP